MSATSGTEDKIWVTGFDDADVQKFYKEFNRLEQASNVPAIVIFIDSFGGSIYGLSAMRDLIKSTEKPVVTVCVGKAMSAGACLLASGTPGYRFAAPNCDIMVHDLSSGMHGTNGEIQNYAKYLSKASKKLMKGFADDIGTTLDIVEELFASEGGADIYLTANEAKRIGMVDHIEIPRVKISKETISMSVVSVKKKKGKPKK